MGGGGLEESITILPMYRDSIGSNNGWLNDSVNKFLAKVFVDQPLALRWSAKKLYHLYFVNFSYQNLSIEPRVASSTQGLNK